MKLECELTLLFGDDGMTIEITDSLSSITFIRLTVDPDNTCKALSRLAHTKCNAEITGLDKVGKTLEIQTFTFQLPDKAKHIYGEDRRILAAKEAVKLCPNGWQPSVYFGSQDSFYIDKTSGNLIARTKIKRWV